MVKNLESTGFWDTPRKVFAIHRHDINWIPNCISSSFEDADFIIMPGGSDWNPALYNEPKGLHTYSDSTCDISQLRVFINALMKDKFIIGICRGAQLCCIESGGKLIQHVNNHVGNHVMIADTDEVLFTNSLHHQMMSVTDISYWKYNVDIVAYARGLSTTYLNGKNAEYSQNDKYYNELILHEPELVYFHKTKCFGIQGHPEMGFDPRTLKFVLNRIAQYYESDTSNNIYGDYSDIEKRLNTALFVYPALKEFFSAADISNWRKRKESSSTTKVLPATFKVFPLKRTITSTSKSETRELIDSTYDFLSDNRATDNTVETTNVIETNEQTEKNWRFVPQTSRLLD